MQFIEIKIINRNEKIRTIGFERIIIWAELYDPQTSPNLNVPGHKNPIYCPSKTHTQHIERSNELLSLGSLRPTIKQLIRRQKWAEAEEVHALRDAISVRTERTSGSAQSPILLLKATMKTMAATLLGSPLPLKTPHSRSTIRYAYDMVCMLLE